MDLTTLWDGLGWPLIRLTFFISLGLMIGNLIEALNWTRGVAKVAEPLTRVARLKDTTGAAFSLAFFSGVAANSMLSEAYSQGRLTKKELVLSNLFNSLPTYFLHLPTMFFITVPFIGHAAFIYVGLTFSSAVLRTVAIVFLGRFLLPPLDEGCVPCRLEENRSKGWRDALAKSWARFKRRIRRIMKITAPIYVAVFFLNHFGAFDLLEQFIADKVKIFAWLPTEALSVMVLQVAAEFTAGLATAGALLDAGKLAVQDLIMALLLGNILSSPMRAFRHQFPYYAGIFNPRLALRLIVYNQSLRVASMIVVATGYFVFNYVYV
jgi:hypothetical protein